MKVKKFFCSMWCGVYLVSGLVGLFSLAVPVTSYAGAPSGFGDDSQVKEDAFNVPNADEGLLGEEKPLNAVRGVINWILGILGMVALIVVIYGGFLMVTAAGKQDQYDKGRKYLKSAAIGLFVIGLAWFAISLVFWLINLTTSQAGSSAGTDG